jgi:hypothetical protein
VGMRVCTVPAVAQSIVLVRNLHHLDLLDAVGRADVKSRNVCLLPERGRGSARAGRQPLAISGSWLPENQYNKSAHYDAGGREPSTVSIANLVVSPPCLLLCPSFC